MTRLSDPQGRRVQAVKELIAMLYDEAAYACIGTLYRMGVISFGSTAEITIDFSQPEGQILVNKGDSRAAWTTRRDAAMERVQPEMRNNAGLRTAIDLADAMLSTPVPDVYAGSSARQAVVILLTDGPPCPDIAIERVLPGIGGNLCQNVNWILHYLNGNQPIFNGYVGENARTGGFEFPYGLRDYFFDTQMLLGNTQFHIVYFTAVQQINAVSILVEEAWSEIASRRRGRYISPRQINGDLNQLGVILDALVSPFLNPRRELILFSPSGSECIGTFVVEPYQDSALLLSLRRSTSGSFPIIEAPSHNPLRIWGEGIPFGFAPYLHVDDTLPELRTIRLDNAPPGVWTVRAVGADCERLDMQIARFPLKIDRLTPMRVTIQADYPYATNDDSARLQIIMTNAFGTLVRFWSDIHPIGGCGVFSTTQPAAQSILDSLPCFRLINHQPGILYSESALPAPGVLNYAFSMQITVESVDPAARTPIVLFTIEHTYSGEG